MNAARNMWQIFLCVDVVVVVSETICMDVVVIVV